MAASAISLITGILSTTDRNWETLARRRLLPIGVLWSIQRDHLQAATRCAAKEDG